MKFRLPSVVSQVGFTMIELLVVIAVIGVLAVAVLSSLNPIEQINKGRDTRARSDAAQLINALDRYFATHEQYPWNIQSTASDDNGNLGDWPAPTPANALYTSVFEFDESETQDITNTAVWAWIQPLVETAEIKESFATRIAKPGVTQGALPQYYIKKPGVANATVYVCFAPSSSGFQVESNKRCTEDETFQTDLETGADIVCPTGCETSTSDEVVCMICLP